MSSLRARFASARVRVSLLSGLTLLAVVLAGTAGTKWG